LHLNYHIELQTMATILQRGSMIEKKLLMEYTGV
jgi:hypothetical protein